MGHSPVYAPFFTVEDFVVIRDTNATKNFFVATTGSDSNSGLSALTPFLTIQHAVDVACTSLRSGKVIINIADGTYLEGPIKLGNMIGSYDYDPSVDFFQGKSVIEFKGNSGTPANVVIDAGAGSTDVFRIDFAPNVTYIFDGMTLQGDTASTNCLTTNRANFVIRNVVMTSCSFGIFMDNWSLGFWDFGLDVNIAAEFLGIQCIDTSTLFIGPNSTITANSGAFCQNDAFIFIFGDCNWTAGATPDRAFQVADRAVLESFAAVINLTDFATGFNVITAGRFINLTSTVNFTDVASPLVFTEDATFLDVGAGTTWNYLGTTPSTVTVKDAVKLMNANAFSGATLSYSESDTDYKYGFDFRYVEPITGHHAGALPLGSTVFLTKANAQSNEFPLYIAEQDEVIDEISMVSVVGNGAAHTDTYEVFKNGAGTGMILSITNASSGSTTANPVTLAAPDRMAIQAVTDAATTAEDVLVQLKIRKI